MDDEELNELVRRDLEGLDSGGDANDNQAEGEGRSEGEGPAGDEVEPSTPGAFPTNKDPLLRSSVRREIFSRQRMLRVLL